MIYKIEIETDGVWTDFSKNIGFPTRLNKRRDEGFDGGVLGLYYLDREEAFRPLIKVKITVDNNVFRYYISNPYKAKVIQGSSPRYNHTFELIEPTKLLERVFADTTTITQRIKGVYGFGFTTVFPEITYENSHPSPWTVTPIWTLFTPNFIGNQIIIPDSKDKFIGASWDSNTVLPASVMYIEDHKGTAYSLGQTIDLVETGATYIEVKLMYYSEFFPVQTFYAILRYNFEVLEVMPDSVERSISSELQRIVKTARTLRHELEEPEYKIDQAILDKYENEVCPEFSMTRQTLWEKLLEVGRYIHAIPRVISDENENWNIITFDFLGSQETADNNSIKNFIESSYSLDDYASDLDTYVSNVINVDNIEEGSIVDPANNIYRTARVEEGGIDITTDNALLMTTKPIAKLLKVVVRHNNTDYDITKYCYESYEYSILSSYHPFFPYSKAYALKYTLGQKNITQLQHKNEDFIDTAFQDYAIVNIMKKEGVSFSSSDIINLQYRIEYVPIVEMRAKQKKVYQDDYKIKSTLVYNQSANSVNSNAYGENIKGAILRYGNEDTNENYYAKSFDEIPKIGTFNENGYISVINYEFYKDFIKYSLEYSKDFNRLSGFVGVNSNVRMYEVSERQVFERTVYCESNITIGSYEENKQSSNTMIELSGVKGLAETFTNETNRNYDPTLARVTTYDKDENIIKEVGLELTTIGFGNSLLFLFNFQDNYSAGEKAIRGQVAGKLIQDYVPYVDSWGGVEYLNFDLCSPDGAVNNQTAGDSLPELNGIVFSNFVASSKLTANTPLGALVVQKDSREHLNITYQIHFLLNDRNIVLGSGLTSLNRLVRQNQSEAVKVYAMPRKIGKFEKVIDLTGATLIKTFSSASSDFEIPENAGDLTAPYFAIKEIETTVDCESLAFVNENGELVMAINKPLMANESSEKIYFNLN